MSLESLVTLPLICPSLQMLCKKCRMSIMTKILRLQTMWWMRVTKVEHSTLPNKSPRRRERRNTESVSLLTQWKWWMAAVPKKISKKRWEAKLQELSLIARFQMKLPKLKMPDLQERNDLKNAKIKKPVKRQKRNRKKRIKFQTIERLASLTQFWRRSTSTKKRMPQ